MLRIRWAAVMALVIAVASFVTLTPDDAAAAKRQRPITRLQYDPSAEEVELFDGMKDGRLDVKVIMKDETAGRVLIENTTDQPLTVQLPEAVVGVQVLQQFGAGAGGGVGGPGGLGGTQGGGGQAQSTGGGLGGGGIGGGGIGGGQGGGGGFFSIPPEKVVAIPMTSVCLEYGKPEPHPRHEYTLIPVSEFSADPRMEELLTMIGTGRIDSQIAQAAAWHISNDMSWQELAALKVKRLGGVPDAPMFSTAVLLASQQLVGMAQARAAERSDDATPSTPVRSRVRP